MLPAIVRAQRIEDAGIHAKQRETFMLNREHLFIVILLLILLGIEVARVFAPKLFS
jgi:hypothetical protein